jgi:MFS family permease
MGIGALRHYKFGPVLFCFGDLLIIPTFSWRWMFVITGIGELGVWYLRRALPGSPRWLESKGHTAAAEKVLSAIETEVPKARPLPPAADQATPIIPRQSIFFCRNYCQAKSNQSGDRIEPGRVEGAPPKALAIPGRSWPGAGCRSS